jgi:tetratricopeptide (TPR) repeat protein
MGIIHKQKSELKLKVARNFEDTGDNLHAVQLYHSVIREDPDFLEAYFSLAELFEKQGNLISAKNILKDYLEDNPESNPVRLFLAQLLLRNSLWEEVIELLNNVLTEEEPLAAFFTGYSYFMMKDFEPAKISFLNFIDNGKKTGLIHEVYVYLAKIEIHLKNFKSALDFAKKAEVVYSDFYELNLLFSIIYYNLGMFAHAVKPIEKALKLNHSDPSSYEWAGRIYLKLSDYIKAESYFVKHIQSVESPSPDIYSSLAEACLKNKKAEDALMYYDIALKLDPQNLFAAEGKKNVSQLLRNQASDV